MEFAPIDSAQADSRVIFYLRFDKGEMHMLREEKKNYYQPCGKVAILIDGGFFLKRLNCLCKKKTATKPITL